MKTFYWYDFETFGANPRRDRASQFAGIRTDENLNIIGKPLVIYCKPAADFLPHPMACLITGITPQKALEEGLPEAEFIRQIHSEFSEPETCVAGYNSIRFDDEMTRQLLYRNFYDPYEREWKNGSSRWDIIDMLRLCAATRPEGINWPRKEDGSKSFRLEQLSVANGIEHEDAHDALSDVIATIEVAKLVKQEQPKLFDYVFELRNKKKVQSQLDLNSQKPVLHVSMMYPATRGCMALVIPLCPHPTNNNGIIVYDLSLNPDEWMHLSVEEIRSLVYSKNEDIPEGRNRIPLKVLHTNKCPIVAPAAVLTDEVASEYGVDKSSCDENWLKLANNAEVNRKVAAVFNEDYSEQEADPDFMIYSGGFFSASDKALMQTIRGTKPTDLARLDLPFRDSRLKEMFFRYRARNYYETLSDQEKTEWEEFRLSKVTHAQEIESFNKELEEAKTLAEQENKNVGSLFQDIETYVQEISKPAL